MKVTVGYYDKDGYNIGRKYPGPERISYLVTGRIVKKIAEIEDTSPYETRDVDRWSEKYCDKNRLVFEIVKFKTGRIVKINNNIADVYVALDRIKRDIDPKKIYYYSRKLNISRENINFKF